MERIILMAASRSILILFVGKGLCWGYGNGIAGMHTHRVEIFDTADNDDIIIVIPKQFQFKFFPSIDGFFDQNFVNRAQFQSTQYFLFELFFSPDDTAAHAAHGK